VNFGTLSVASSTLSGNVGGDIVCRQAGVAMIWNSIVDGDCQADPGAVNLTDGYNIESPGDTCGFDKGTDLVNIAEGQLDLGQLQNNGGPTMTHALGVDSVALDRIPEVDCEVTEDQRGVTRPQGDACDVGAFELEVAP